MKPSIEERIESLQDQLDELRAFYERHTHGLGTLHRNGRDEPILTEPPRC